MFSFMANTLGHLYKNFQGFTYCSVFKVLCCRLSDSSFTISQLRSLVNNFFKVFSNRFRFAALSLKDKAYPTTTWNKCQHFFVEIFQIVLTAYTIHQKRAMTMFYSWIIAPSKQIYFSLDICIIFDSLYIGFVLILYWFDTGFVFALFLLVVSCTPCTKYCCQCTDS